MRTLRVDLCGEWEYRRLDAEGAHEWRTGRVPGSVQADLLAAGGIEDPFVGTNEERVQWVSGARWVYRRRFSAPAVPKGGRAYLVFEGLDTFAAVLLNGVPVGAADNMFVPWRFDVTESLAVGENEAEVVFDSTETCAKAAAEAYGVPLQNVARAPNASFVRKAACHFGWDWGPTLLVVGLWRPVRLEIVARGYLAAVDAWGEPGDGGSAVLHMAVEAAGARLDGLAATVRAVAPDGRTEVGTAEAPLVGGRATLAVPVARAEPWWPNGMGGQPLYTLRVRLAVGRRVVDEETVRVGVRRLELVREPDEFGRSFHFRVNGAALFAKGANWIPGDALPARVTAEGYRHLVASCAAAGMNMLRVWGGGYYEDEAFYDACDELGILVWQDFMFACAMYPGDDDDFADSVRAEAEAAIRRLRRHTALAFWCGNNEMESAWFEWGWDRQHPERVWHAYERLFHNLLPAAVAALDPRRAYVPSSPHSAEAGRPNDPASGDAHLWHVWHGPNSHLGYLGCGHRFVSEFGFQSLPCLETLGPVIPPEERRMDSPSMLQHQKSGGGNQKIAQAVEAWLGPPKDFESLIYLSQVYQALAIRTGVEHWRRSAPRTMGALYWQANDCWPVLSWASLDYAGRWKALHYGAKRFFAPYLVSGLADETVARVWCTADFGTAPAEGELRWQVLAWDGRRLAEGRQAAALAPGATVGPLEVRWADVPGASPEGVCLAADLVVGTERVGRTVLTPLPPARVALPDPRLRATVRADRGGAAVDVSAEGVALAVGLEAPGAAGRFEDNFFDLLPGERRTVRLAGGGRLGPTERRALAAALRLRSLCDAQRQDPGAV